MMVNPAPFLATTSANLLLLKRKGLFSGGGSKKFKGGIVNGSYVSPYPMDEKDKDSFCVKYVYGRIEKLKDDIANSTDELEYRKNELGYSVAYYKGTDILAEHRDCCITTEYDKLGRKVRVCEEVDEFTNKYSTTYYSYYGDTNQLREVVTRGSLDGVEYMHYNENGEIDTKKHLKEMKQEDARRRIAQKRIERENELSEGKEKRVILPKMSKILKVLAYKKEQLLKR